MRRRGQPLLLCHVTLTVATLLRVSNDIQQSLVFDPAPAAKDLDFEIKHVAAYALRPDGSVSQLATDFKDRSFLVEFTIDGAYKRAVQLNRQMEPTALAVFGSGGFIVSGLSVTQSEPRQGQSVLALFDANGRFVKNIDTGESTLDASDTARGVQLGRIESGTDHVYLLRQTSKPYVLVITASGDVLRRIDLSTPSGALVSDIRIGPGRMLVRSYRAESDAHGRQSAFYTLYDNVEGPKIIDFQESKEISGIFACFDWKNTFSYLGVDSEGRRLLVRGFAR